MKTMTCKQLGGPDSCDHQLHAETFEEMGEQSKQHAMQMANDNDQTHIEVMEKMKQSMSDPVATKAWMEEKQKLFESLPEN